MTTSTPAPGAARQQLSNDVENLAAVTGGLDPRLYFDSQAEDAWRTAATRWPLLADVLGLANVADERPPR